MGTYNIAMAPTLTKLVILALLSALAFSAPASFLEEDALVKEDSPAALVENESPVVSFTEDSPEDSELIEEETDLAKKKKTSGHAHKSNTCGGMKQAKAAMKIQKLKSKCRRCHQKCKNGKSGNDYCQRFNDYCDDVFPCSEDGYKTLPDGSKTKKSCVAATEFKSVRCEETPWTLDGADGLAAKVQNGDQPAGYCTVKKPDLTKDSSNRNLCPDGKGRNICAKFQWTVIGPGTWKWEQRGADYDGSASLHVDGVQIKKGISLRKGVKRTTKNQFGSFWDVFGTFQLSFKKGVHEVNLYASEDCCNGNSAGYKGWEIKSIH